MLSNETSNCEDCLYFDSDEETGEEFCALDLDEDEWVRLLSGHTNSCPYYRFYDEYKMVRKQNGGTK